MAGPRLVSNEIWNNRGLVKYRKKEDKNPRLRRRHKYEKMIMRRKGLVQDQITEGSADGITYDGESSGIRTNNLMFHLVQKVKELEEELAAVKPWDLTGEVTAKDRPLHSILEADVELPFQKAALREQKIDMKDDKSSDSKAGRGRTNTFENAIASIIKRRVADGVFDDRAAVAPAGTKASGSAEQDTKPEKEKVKRDKKAEEDALLKPNKERPGLTKTYEEDHQKRAKSDETAKNKAKRELDEVFGKLVMSLDELCNFQSCSAGAYAMTAAGGSGRSKRVRAAQASVFAEDIVPFSTTS